MHYNGPGYEYLRGLALNFASTHQTENPRGFSEVSENKQLLIANVGCSLFLCTLVIFKLELCVFQNRLYSENLVNLFPS